MEAAFEGFYREHVAEVYQYALAVLGNSADAEDVTQQTFLNAYRAFERGERPSKAHNWLIKIAHNVCRMRWRQSSRRLQEVPLERAGEPAALDDEKPSLDEVLTALAKLPFNQRAAIVMREVEDRSYAEIAEVLGVTVPAVEALLFRARGNLRATRKSLAGALGVAPIPVSLGSFFGGGSGGLIAAGGAALAPQLALKAAAIVAAGAIAGGLGYKAVDAVATPEPSASPSQDAQAFIQPSTANQLQQPAALGRAEPGAAAFRHPRRGVSRDGKLGSAPTTDRPSESGGPAAQAPDSAAASGAASTVAGAPAATVKGVVSSVTQPPALPTTPVTVSTPVTSVTATVPTLTVPTLTVPTVTLPPPPTLP